MPDRARVIEVILDDSGALSKLVVEQEDHTIREVSAGLTPGSLSVIPTPDLYFPEYGGLSEYVDGAYVPALTPSAGRTEEQFLNGATVPYVDFDPANSSFFGEGFAIEEGDILGVPRTTGIIVSSPGLYLVQGRSVWASNPTGYRKIRLHFRQQDGAILTPTRDVVLSARTDGPTTVVQYEWVVVGSGDVTFYLMAQDSVSWLDNTETPVQINEISLSVSRAMRIS